MFTPEDFTMLEAEADNVFDNLPQESRFSFIWKKANVTPGGRTFQTAWEAVPGILVPPSSQSQRNGNVLGSVVMQDHLEVAIPKRYGETITLDGLTFVGGLQIHDRVDTQDGTKYEIVGKQRRGYGAYYVLQLIPYQGQDDSWVAGQFNR